VGVGIVSYQAGRCSAMVTPRWRRTPLRSYAGRRRKTSAAAVANTGVMTSRPLQIPDDDLVAWRRRRLCRAGFDAALADVVARDCAMDLHALLELVDRGCPPALAARILAPLEDEHRPC
jgi:hypothetical protein